MTFHSPRRYARAFASIRQSPDQSQEAARSSLKRAISKTNQGQNTIRIIPVDSGEMGGDDWSGTFSEDKLTPWS